MLIIRPYIIRTNHKLLISINNKISNDNMSFKNKIEYLTTPTVLTEHSFQKYSHDCFRAYSWTRVTISEKSHPTYNPVTTEHAIIIGSKSIYLTNYILCG